MAGGVNLYAYAGNNPVAYKDPYGLCVPVNVCLAAAGALIGGGSRIAYNLYKGKDWKEGVGSDMARGAAIGLTMGLAAPAIAMATTSTAGTATAADAGAAKLTIQFGRVANQVSHAFRHTDAVGLDRAEVQSAVEQHLTSVASELVPGKTLNQVIEVAGQKIQYSAHLIAEGVANVGRIHPVE